MKLVTFLGFSAILILGVKCRSYDQKINLKNGIFEVHYSYNTTDKKFYFKVVAKTTGWVGLALTLEKGAEDMKNYDIVLGGVRGNNNNVTYIGDYWSVSLTKPTYDTKQDVTLGSAMEKNGMTTLEFSRLAVTGEMTQDIKIEEGKLVYFAWAIGTEDALSDTNFMKHPDKANNGRGHTTVGYDMFKNHATSLVSSTAILIIAALFYFFV